jgi:hypothetical protein
VFVFNRSPILKRCFMSVFKSIAIVSVVSVALAYLVLAPSSNVAVGQSVSALEASLIRGGICQTMDTATCPDTGVSGCGSCTKVVGGTTKGTGSGSCYCVSDCGSFWASIDTCSS